MSHVWTGGTGLPHKTPTHFCEVCGAKSTDLRRGRCWICYVRWADARPVGIGASCAVCREQRRDNLRMVEFQGSWTPMCHNCAAKMQQMVPTPASIEGVRERLTRDRRWQERRKGKKDHRIFASDRRSDERRRALRDVDGLEWINAEDLIIEIHDADEHAEATRIKTLAETPGDPAEQQA